MPNGKQELELRDPLNRDVTGDARSHPHWPLVERIAQSPHFRKSPRSRELLLFIAERALESRTQELTEHNIACAVFDRFPEFSPSEDNIVRVSMRQLRAKLKDYFDIDGLKEEVTIELPKGAGAYVPIFKPVALPLPLPGTERWPWLAWVAAGTSLVALVALTLAWWFWRENRLLNGAGSPPTIAGELLLKSNQPVTVVIPDFGLAMTKAVTGRFVQLDDYASHRYLASPPKSEELALSLWRTLTRRQITTFGDVMFVSKLFKAHAAHRSQIVVRHAVDMTIRDFQTGQFILLGSSASTPWVSLFEQRFNFRFDPRGFFTNTRPQAGEPPLYRRRESGDNGEVSYARIGLAPNLSGTGRVLLVAGINMAATEAATDFLMSPASVSLVKQTFGVRDLSTLTSFEIMLQTSSLGGAGSGARVVSVRR